MSGPLNEQPNLRRNAPGLFGALVRLSSPIDPRFELAFALSCRNGGLEEGSIQRTPGASFNPRPARICQILLSESSEQNPETLCAALLVPSRTQAPFPPELNGAAAILSEARAFSLGEAQVSAAAERVALACHLDELRHVHMREISEEEKVQVRSESRRTYLERPLHEENARLRVLIEACLRRMFGGSSKCCVQ